MSFKNIQLFYIPNFFPFINIYRSCLIFHCQDFNQELKLHIWVNISKPNQNKTSIKTKKPCHLQKQKTLKQRIPPRKTSLTFCREVKIRSLSPFEFPSYLSTFYLLSCSVFPLNSFSAFLAFSKSHFLDLITDTSSSNAMLLRHRKAHQQFLSWIPYWPIRNMWFYGLKNCHQEYLRMESYRPIYIF